MNGPPIARPGRRRPTITVALPVYNGERFLARALDSILGQTLTDLEVVISDNASTDGTADICEKYAALDGRVRYVRNERNIGAAPNFNRALELARGHFFKWASYDDWLEPTYLERCVEALKAQPDLVAAWPRTKIYDESGDLLEYYVHPAGLSSPDAYERIVQWIWNTKEFAPIFGVFPLDVVLATRRMESYASADRTFFAEVVLQGRVLEVDEYLFCTTRSTTVRAGRDTTWWDTRPVTRPTFDRWRYLLLMHKAIMAAPTMSWRRRCRAAGVNALFFARGWPRAALLGELGTAARYYRSTAARSTAARVLLRRGPTEHR